MDSPIFCLSFSTRIRNTKKNLPGFVNWGQNLTQTFYGCEQSSSFLYYSIINREEKKHACLYAQKLKTRKQEIKWFQSIDWVTIIHTCTFFHQIWEYFFSILLLSRWWRRFNVVLCLYNRKWFVYDFYSSHMCLFSPHQIPSKHIMTHHWEQQQKYMYKQNTLYLL